MDGGSKGRLERKSRINMKINTEFSFLILVNICYPMSLWGCAKVLALKHVVKVIKLTDILKEVAFIQEAAEIQKDHSKDLSSQITFSLSDTIFCSLEANVKMFFLS